MPAVKKAVFFFCPDEGIDPVAPGVFEEVRKLFRPEETGISMDDFPVLAAADSQGNKLHFVRTKKVVCHDYARYLPDMVRHFGSFHMAGLVTWHEGDNAPDGILSVHTTGDVDSGHFGKAEPLYMRNLLLALENRREELGLVRFKTVTEATHWSGMIYGGGCPERISAFPVPIVDIEIGSTTASWSDRTARKALASSLGDVFQSDGKKLLNILCVGGVHFESAFSGAAMQAWGEKAFGVSHILANQWLVSGGYEGEEGLRKLAACIASISGGVAGIAFHDNLKGPLKEQLRRTARDLSIPAFKHQLLRRPGDIPFGGEA